MNKNEIKTFIENEIKKLNVKIDRKIVLGQDYKKDAQQHRVLWAKLQAIV